MTTAKKPLSVRRQAPPQSIRIIGGIWKRSLLPVSALTDLRPTPVRVRETVFNWLFHFFSARWETLECLDLFAGTGAFGFEAASRGVRHVTLVERNRIAFERLSATCRKLDGESRMTLLFGSAKQTADRMVSQGIRFDIIFLDPPFQSDALPTLLPVCADLLKEGGMVYVESPVPLDENRHDAGGERRGKWEICRRGRAGRVCYHLLRMQYDAD
ncbi:MAG: 16S rRNA (guanine(966)-N(2))-methyltransferase RsmD [Burkholderiaceae bacterium]|jgi:16S rRNA (guanine(966)-N(2))-methyltransferase RsmD|nr:16S rRNA (guanine(966)-N(2))-methyltransferase RsmD [Burkholderiaceae bacterium]